MAKKKNITQPNEDDERLLNDIIEDSKDIVNLRGKEWSIGWMKHGTQRKITDIVLKEKDESKVSTKCAAVMLLNGYWKILFLYPILWRWMYYIKQYDDNELLPIIELCKKKVPLETFCVTTILLTETKDTIMTMTREEVNRFRQENVSVQRGASGKSTDA